MFGVSCKSLPKAELFTSGVALIEDGRYVNMLHMASRSSLSTFYEKLKQDFGSPVKVKRYTVYKSMNRRFAEDSMILRVQEDIVDPGDAPKYKLITICAETIHKYDLLIPYSQSQKSFSNYFYEFYKHF